ncbi:MULTISPECIES: hypothetical protein [Mycobacteroides]|jgi:hypothetical protein|uniref:Uncharacterized protein n=1 Tax=Mycobacteroides chelonae TaxID=1774 RepID=A0AB73LZP0_MYCCH|nr:MULTISPECIES: hypothetical protein [Mycobacteroides]KRQ31292.1 hypothetical protein AOT86_01365 [Mycobacteroides sp. H072]KRQ35951.1 hypothetical protein AOT84_15745 [Mycobacteroides sp. H002]KRQ50511.1 hypothetical protein AOT85_13485 [Mycobacteroides sp. H054]KRQ72727.1 hypothetical protein AOT83_05040 [Mycobacteroides sp. H001]MBN7369290.1 hypothetical protein [Mycobacteroides abscessus subsp. abscessus]
MSTPYATPEAREEAVSRCQTRHISTKHSALSDAERIELAEAARRNAFLYRALDDEDLPKNVVPEAHYPWSYDLYQGVCRVHGVLRRLVVALEKAVAMGSVMPVQVWAEVHPVQVQGDDLEGITLAVYRFLGWPNPLLVPEEDGSVVDDEPESITVEDLLRIASACWTGYGTEYLDTVARVRPDNADEVVGAVTMAMSDVHVLVRNFREWGLFSHANELESALVSMGHTRQMHAE